MILSVKQSKTVYTVIVEFDIEEVVIVSRALTCDNELDIQEHQIIGLFKSKGAVKKMIAEQGTLLFAQKMVNKSLQRSKKQFTQAKREYTVINEKTGAIKKLGSYEEIADHLGISYQKVMHRVQKYQKTDKSKPMTLENFDGVHYSVTMCDIARKGD